MNPILPSYQMSLINKVEKAIWAASSSYKNVSYYIKKWHEEDDFNYQNFEIHTKENSEIDLLGTLHSMGGEILLKIAIDLGIETPGFIPSIPIFRQEISSSYQTAATTFEKAFKQVEEHPDLAIGLVNSALESIIKEILKDESFGALKAETKTLYDLTVEVLKQFQMYPGLDVPKEVKTIGSSLLAINQSIEKMRSEKTILHGKTGTDYVVSEPLYAYFIVNSVATVGLFLKKFYESKYRPLIAEFGNDLDDDLPF